MKHTIPPKFVWPCINYRDAVAAIEFLTGAFGFQSTLVHEDGGHIRHAELRWPEGGGIMVGSESPDGTPFERLPTGSSGLYVVTDDPDTVFERATRAGATVIHGLKDEDYGSRGFTVADPEGNLWSFGTYRGS